MQRLLVATLVAGSAAFVAPAPASAICWSGPLYDLTGYCGPCQIANAGIGTVNDVTEYATGDEWFGSLICLA